MEFQTDLLLFMPEIHVIFWIFKMYFIPAFYEKELYHNLLDTQLMIHNKISLSFRFVHSQPYKQLIEIFVS